MKKAGLYIHIPFCAKRCRYCSFISCEGAGENYINSYFNALVKEILKGKNIYKDYIIKTIYIGGGTPSYVNQNHISDIFKLLKDNFNIGNNAEISIEANPNTLTENKLEAYLLCGINRYSIGLQTADDRLLKIIGRVHNYGDYFKCIELLKKYDVKNFSTDIMLGLPSQNMEDVKNTVAAVMGLNVPHISAYGLKLEEGTELYDMVKDRSLTLPDDDTSADMYEYVLNGLKKYGIYRYEVSNFAKKGYECRHNINYWERGEYFGFGAAAHSFTDNVRTGNIEGIKAYITAAENNLSTASFAQEINQKDAEFEYIMLNLRMESGINLYNFQTLFNEDFILKYEKIIKKLKDLLITDSGCIKASDKGFMVLNSILTEFLV